MTGAAPNWWDALPTAPAPVPVAGRDAPPAGAGGQWWEALPLAPEKTATPASRGGLMRNIGAGLIEGGAGLLNIMSDPFGNLVGNPLAVAGQFAHDALTQTFGYERFPDNIREALLTDTVPQIGTRAIDALADVAGIPKAADVKPNSEGERLARKLTTGTMIGAAIGPTAIGAAAGAGGTLAGDLAAQASPDWAAPMAELGGNVAGGAVTGVGAYGVQRGVMGAKNQAGLIGIGERTTIGEGLPGAPAVTEAQANRGARMFRDAAGEQLPQLREALAAGGPDEIMPGAPATTAQLTANRPEGTPLSRMSGLEQSARNRDQAPFVEIQRQQRDAMARGVEGLKPATFDPNGLADFFIGQLDQQMAGADAAIGAAERGVRQATGAVGDVVEPALVGQDARKATTEALQPVRAHEGKLWSALRDNPDLALNIDPTLETVGMLRREAADTAHVSGATHPKVATLLEQAGSLPQVARWRDMIELRKQATDLGRRLATGENLSTNDMRRVTLVKESIDASIKKAVAEAAEFNPEFAAALRAEVEQHNAAIRPSESAVGPVPSERPSGNGVGNVPPQSGGQVPGERGRTDVPDNNGVAAGSAARGRQPETLVDFLISKGGVRDQGGELRANDLQTVHHRAGGRLLNPRGQTLDYAREAAAEAGFIRPNADINEFLDAVTSRGPVYRISEQADGAGRAQQAREGRLTDEARLVHSANVEDAAAAAGAKLSKVELDHATELAMQGAHPDQAIRDAVAFSEDMVLQRNAERNAVGAPGVPLAARQSEMLAPPEQPRLIPNLTAQDATTYGAARTATAEKHRVFGQGPVGRMMERGEGSPFKVADADVAGIFARNNPSAVQNYGALVEAVGKSRADALMQQFLVNDLKDQSRVYRPDGTLDVKGFQNWMAGPRGRVIEQIPGLKEKFATAEAAQETLNAAEGAKADVLKRYRSSIKGRFLPPESGDAALAQGDIVKQVLSGPNSGPAFTRLVGEASKDVHATESLKADVADYLMRRFTNLEEAGPGAQADFTKAETFRNWVGENRTPLKKLYGGQGVQTIEQIAAAIRRVRSVKVEGEGSPTARYLQQSERHGLGGGNADLPLIGVLGYMAGEAVAAGAGKIPLLGTAWYAARQAGLESAKDVVAFAAAHPSVAREMMTRIRPDGTIGPVAQRRIGAAILAAVAAGSQTRASEDAKQ